MNKFKVPIKNALFMYSYIWDKVESTNYTNLSSEDDFESSDIYAELFLINIKTIIKKGLYKEYETTNDSLGVIKGKIDFISTINKQSLKNGNIFCDYDRFTENNLLNQIIKSIAIRLYKTTNLSLSNKRKINRIILYFNQVDYVELEKKHFENLNFNKLNNYYFWMIKICEFIFNSQMLSEEKGFYSFYDLFNTDDNMNNVFELFIYKFYTHELNKKYKVKFQSILNWNIKGENRELLPVMKLDTLITSPYETIIIDTKYYKTYFDKNNYDTKKFKSTHLYQMMAYMNNYDRQVDTKLRGILLYPKPFDEENIDEVYEAQAISKNEITEVKLQITTIDLSLDWKSIKDNLLRLVADETETL